MGPMNPRNRTGDFASAFGQSPNSGEPDYKYLIQLRQAGKILTGLPC
jgi:hypothetical protein